MSVTYSGFWTDFLKSNYGVSGYNDILSATNDISANSTVGLVNASYFYLGNLLVQYSNIGNGPRPGIGNNTTTTITFPIAYANESKPMVLATLFGSNGTCGVNNVSNTSFDVQVGGGPMSSQYPNWIAIG